MKELDRKKPRGMQSETKQQKLKVTKDTQTKNQTQIMKIKQKARKSRNNRISKPLKGKHV